MNAVVLLDASLEKIWDTLCDAFDTPATMPGLPALLEGAELARPEAARVAVLVNMLAEIAEQVSPYSKWYSAPACAFGLRLQMDYSEPATWTLTDEALQRWEVLLDRLEFAIQRNTVLLQATVLVEELIQRAA